MSQFDRSAAASFALRRRRECRHQEWTEQKRLAALLDRHLDPATTFWTSLENKPRSARIGMIQRQRGIRSGLPDSLVLHRGLPAIFIELKSRAGVASKVQKQIRRELIPAGATWWLARSARAAMTALVRSGVVFRVRWKAPDVLQPWEGPFADTRKLPMAREVKLRRQAAVRRYKARRRERIAAAALTAPLATDQGHEEVADPARASGLRT